MSELYRTSESADAAPAADTPVASPADGDTQQTGQPGDLTQDTGALEGDGYTGYEDGGTLAAEEDGLPTRQEAWEQTWGDTVSEQAMDSQDKKSTANADELEGQDAASNSDDGPWPSIAPSSKRLRETAAQSIRTLTLLMKPRTA